MPGTGENDDETTGEPADPTESTTDDPFEWGVPTEDVPEQTTDQPASPPDDESTPTQADGEESRDSRPETGEVDSGETTPTQERPGGHAQTGRTSSSEGGTSHRETAPPRQEDAGPKQVTGPRDGGSRRPQGEREDEEEGATWLLVSRDVVVTIAAVVLLGSYLFAVSGVWPPMVAIESGSMEPNMNVNDMVFVMETDRFQPDAAHGDTGVVTAETGAEAGYTQYGESGDVIIFEPGGDEDETPIIHRAMFWVEEGENWYDRANRSYVGTADSCAELSSCPAPNAGFITKGDANGGYDQATFGSSNNPVKPDWIIGTAELRVPRLGWFRLQF